MGDSNRTDKLVTPEDIQNFFKEEISAIQGGDANTIMGMLRMLGTNNREHIMEETLQQGYAEAAWMFREAGRFITKEYVHLRVPENNDPVGARLNSLLSQRINHFIHCSKDEPLYIAYTPSEEYGKQDRRVKTTVGRYLKKHYPELTDLDIRALSDAHRYYYGTDDILWAASAADIERVYTTGPHSCMAYIWTDTSTRFGSHMHPSVVYADLPWFRLAYLERNGKINARCLTYINPDDSCDKRWVRIYGDDLLRVKLENSGFVKSNLEGARIHKIPAIRTDGALLPDTYVCPYIDDQTGREMQTLATDGSALFKIGRGSEYLGTHTQGLTGQHYSYIREAGARWSLDTPEEDSDSDDEESTGTCDICTTRVPDDSLEWSEFHEDFICDGCRSEYVEAIYTLEGRQTLVRADSAVEIDGRFFVATPNDIITIAAGYTRLTHHSYEYDTFHETSDCLITAKNEYIKAEDAALTHNCLSYHHVDDTWTSVKGYVFHDDENLTTITTLRVNLETGALEFINSANPENSETDLLRVDAFFLNVARKTPLNERMSEIGCALLQESSIACGALYNGMNYFLRTQHPELLHGPTQQPLPLETAA